MSAEAASSSGLPAGSTQSRKSRHRTTTQQQPAIPPGGTLIPNRVFVGGIPPGTDEAELRKFFSIHGAVSDVKIIADKSGSSRIYGFVTFEDANVAEQIVQRESRDGLVFNQRRINIGPAIKKPPTSARLLLDAGGLSSAAAAAAALSAAISAASVHPWSGQIALQSIMTQSQQQQQQQLSQHSLISQLFPTDLLLSSLTTAQQPQLLTAAPWLTAAAIQQQQQQQQQQPLQVQVPALQQPSQPPSFTPQQPFLPNQQLFDLAAVSSNASEAKRRRCEDWPLSEWSLQ